MSVRLYVNFAFEDGGVTAATCKYYSPLTVSSITVSYCKELHLKCGRVPRSIFEKSCHTRKPILTVW